eukprot:CAMPEP_0172913860 /NCGR_PEP_ID=MMETSP1075-20121228/191231_1 /TAXON_ID=2916 /ORGANISM="Ceratium fusus, Strain PA161109" /LENGTH=51 /DNA_ID=CAMNT_0013772667 /DNA_START=547 /DNA_END=698 /DNA_ORIENTATION=-
MEPMHIMKVLQSKASLSKPVQNQALWQAFSILTGLGNAACEIAAPSVLRNG